jgi:3-oxoacyl-[acyl-carrier-protein] synthase II
MVEVVVTGTGAVTPLGGDTASTWLALLAGRTAVRRWDDLAAEGFPVQAACRVDDGVWGPEAVPDPCRRGSALGRRAAAEALAQAGLLDDGRLVDRLAPDRVACFVGTTMGESAVFETAAQRGRFDLAQGGGQVFAESVSAAFGLTGPRRTYGTACAAGNYAVAAAARAVASGRVDVALAGGVEPFSRIAMLGFSRMRAMAPDGCTPFGANRRGMTLGEGAAFLVLQRRDDVDYRRALATIGSIGLSADAHHPTAPREDGVHMQAAMRTALSRTGIDAGDVGWVSAHGTGTALSDAVEAKSVLAVLGSGAPVSSIKGALGHTMGAATAIEAVAAVCALRERVLPPNTGPTELDASLDIDVLTACRPAPDLEWVMSCGFAFGGLNSALLLGRAA